MGCFHTQGPFSGAIFASLVYECVFRPDYDLFIDAEGEQIQELGNDGELLSPSMKSV